MISSVVVVVLSVLVAVTVCDNTNVFWMADYPDIVLNMDVGDTIRYNLTSLFRVEDLKLLQSTSAYLVTLSEDSGSVSDNLNLAVLPIKSVENKEVTLTYSIELTFKMTSNSKI